VNSPDPFIISNRAILGSLRGVRWRRKYSDRKVFLVRSLLMEDIFGLEDGFEDVGFSILVSLSCK
jgi:hypothetical protein